MNIFYSKEDFLEYLEETTIFIGREPIFCDKCGKRLADCDGFEHYYEQDDLPGYYFCSMECLADYLLNNSDIIVKEDIE